MDRPLRLLSVVAPVYDEDALVEAFHARVCGALEGIPFELVLVDVGLARGVSVGRLELGVGRHVRQLHVAAARTANDVAQRGAEAVGGRDQSLLAHIACDAQVGAKVRAATSGALAFRGHEAPYDAAR
jgi:hypothetical protein